MAPDLNSVPPSPRPPAASVSPRNTSRRTSQQMLPPMSPSLNILPSNQQAVGAAMNPPLASPGVSTTMVAGGERGVVGDNTGVGAGPGPLRHPRPLTAADLHLQLEKEQEAVVNRLTRELSMLRAAQNASVVSNTSSTSTGLPDSTDNHSNHLLSGPSHPAPSQRRHHRTSSSTSTRSITSGTAQGIAGLAPSSTADRTRGNLPRHDSISQSQSLSRQNSTVGRSGASSPVALSSSYQYPDHFPHYFHTSRPSLQQHREPSSSSNLTNLSSHDPSHPHPIRSDSITSVQTSGRYEETAFHRHELDAVKRENEGLKRRIRELERTLRARRQSDASATERMRSESVSTTASVRDSVMRDISGVGRGRERGEREKEEEDGGVRVGESARSAGVLR